MLSADIQDILELDVQELEPVDAPSAASIQIPPRTITTCALC